VEDGTVTVGPCERTFRVRFSTSLDRLEFKRLATAASLRVSGDKNCHVVHSEDGYKMMGHTKLCMATSTATSFLLRHSAACEFTTFIQASMMGRLTPVSVICIWNFDTT
jgi:hypothetical protein